jgi:hypothetical protein
MLAEAGLALMAALVRPGGVLVVVDLARSRQLEDYAFDLAGAIATRAHRHLLRLLGEALHCGYRCDDAAIVPQLAALSIGRAVIAGLRRPALQASCQHMISSH